MRKNLHDIISKGEPKEQHLSIVPKSCSIIKLKKKKIVRICEEHAPF